MATLSSPTLGKLITNIRNFLNQPSANNSFWTDQELTEYINEGVRMYFAEAAQKNEGLFTTQVDLDVTAGQETVLLPSDCFEVRALYKSVDNGYHILDYVNNLTSSYSSQSATSGNTYFPYYYFRENSLVLRPVPAQDETAGLRLEYIRFPETLVNGGDTLTSQVSPVFKQLIEMYAVYKAKLKESLVNGVVMHKVAEDNLADIVSTFRDAITLRSKNPTYVQSFNPELA